MMELLLSVLLWLQVRVNQPLWNLTVGTVTATVQEQQECYFSVGQHVAIVTHPKSECCRLLRELVGHSGTLRFAED